MTHSNRNHRLPRRMVISPPPSKAALAELACSPYISRADLIVRGQGVILFYAAGPCGLVFYDANNVVKLRVRFTEAGVRVQMEPSMKPLIDIDAKPCITTRDGVYYWFSIDSHNQRLYAGVGETRIENIVYSYTFPQDSASATVTPFLESLFGVEGINLQITTLLRDPITRRLPLLIKDTEELTMDSIALATYFPKTNLSLTAQKLYNCIAGKQFVLDTPDFPEFTKAIEYSIATPGKWCYECLKQKATEFSKDKPNYEETYLRITLGENNGESPGIPYVMEIWPVGHYSPVHNHGGSSAIVRVLRGSIHVTIFPYLSSDGVAPCIAADVNTGDITWISPNLNQVHQLKNLDTQKDTCITIQCYMYEDDNTEHYDYFDYIEESQGTQQFEPNSDMEFIEFKRLMKKEWFEHRFAW